MSWKKKIDKYFTCLERLSVLDKHGTEIRPETAFQKWMSQTHRIATSKKTVFFIGNGASASMSSHFATDLAKNASIHTRTFYDLSEMTAIANDICFEEVFAEPLRLWMEPGDMLIAISSSGQSHNVLRAVETALEIGGYVVSLSAMRPENRLRSMGVLNFYVPAQTYGVAETCHAAVLHHWTDMVAARAKCERSRSTVRNAIGKPLDPEFDLWDGQEIPKAGPLLVEDMLAGRNRSDR